MEKDRKIKVLSLCALLVAVLGLTVAFAALSQTLTFFYLGKDDTVLLYKNGDIINSGDKITGGVRLDYNKVSIDGGEPTITESIELLKRKLEFSNLNIKLIMYKQSLDRFFFYAQGMYT